MALSKLQQRRYKNLNSKIQAGETLKPRLQARYDKLLGMKTGAGAPEGVPPELVNGGGGMTRPGGKYLNKASGKAQKVVDTGMGIGQQILPEVFEGGEGSKRQLLSGMIPQGGSMSWSR
jgi:hypothetical protein